MKGFFENILIIRRAPEPALPIATSQRSAILSSLGNDAQMYHCGYTVLAGAILSNHAGISGSMSILWISAATPNSPPSPASTRKIRAWQQTQHFSPEVNSGGSISTNSTFAPSLTRASVERNTPFELTSRVSALNSTCAPALRTRTGNRAAILSPDRRSILEFIYLPARANARTRAEAFARARASIDELCS